MPVEWFKNNEQNEIQKHFILTVEYFQREKVKYIYEMKELKYKSESWLGSVKVLETRVVSLEVL